MHESTASNSILITEAMIREELRNVIQAKLVGNQMLTGASFELDVRTALQPLIVETVRAQLKSIFTAIGYGGMI